MKGQKSSARRSTVAAVSHKAGGGHAQTLSRAPSIAKGAKTPGDYIEDARRHAQNHYSGADMQSHHQYSHIKFPDYEYQEFPKHVTPPGGGAAVVCNNEEEEDAVLSSGVLVREEDERARLVKCADVFGVQIDRRWKLEKIVGAIEAAGFDPQHNPDA